MKQQEKKILQRLGWFGVLLMTVGGKLKALLPLLKFGKFGGTIISMAISVGAYALLYPWQFALGLILMILIHEMGHVWAAKNKGLPVSAPSFIPFLGALITMKKQPRDAATEAYIALGGPLLGSFGALVCYGFALWTDWSILYVIAQVGFFLNLFNLIPIHPLDGGRIVVAITRWLWIVGLILGLYVIIKLQSILLGIFYLMFVWELWGTFFRKKGQEIKTFLIKVQVPVSRFENMLMPGTSHRRTLSFQHYCELDTQQDVVEIHFPGVGPIGKIEDVPWIAHEIRLIKTLPVNHHPELMEMHLEVDSSTITGGIQKESAYYQVPLRIRWLFGLIYIGLAAFLAYMLLISPAMQI